MSIEELTKSQLILLALMVSFITSIATGIVTVSLLDEAPPVFTQTVNRVVERTIETVVTEPGKQQAAAGTVKETTVVVREEDLITDSIEKNAQALARVYRSEDESTFLGMGFFAGPGGHVVTASSFITPGEDYYVKSVDGTKFHMEVLKDNTVIAVLKFHKSEEGGETTPIVFADLSGVKLGQTVIAITGENSESISQGIISGLNDVEGKITRVNTTINTNPILYGSPLINMFGEVVGIHTDLHGQFVPVSSQVLAVETPKEESSTNEE